MLNRAFAREADNCMFINMNGHLVVDPFALRLSFAMLSMPAHKDNAIVRLDEEGDNQPKACNAAKDARSSADVDAHWAPPPSGFKRYGTSSLSNFKENQRLDSNSQPPKTTQSSVHLASVLNCSALK
jgi:hypothetical protein